MYPHGHKSVKDWYSFNWVSLFPPKTRSSSASARQSSKNTSMISFCWSASSNLYSGNKPLLGGGILTHQHHLLDRVEIGHSSPCFHVLEDSVLFEELERVVLCDVLIDTAFKMLLCCCSDDHWEDVIRHT
ncbi:hypothetical protein JZ751_024800 [Albula glossodonta]|uniref:Uncharacterized protein n=1 Tax=Albula glossodonta TaxID=121402 RepID=A0A8T2PIC9_9TELE|nr:hypothetical protein JZ751_024800 [Albula glossodonta]